MVSLILGMFQICFLITSVPPMELKPNQSVSYTKVRVFAPSLDLIYLSLSLSVGLM